MTWDCNSRLVKNGNKCKRGIIALRFKYAIMVFQDEITDSQAFFKVSPDYYNCIPNISE